MCQRWLATVHLIHGCWPARHQFGALQNKTFPVYFLQSIILSGALLTKWIYSHPDVLTNITRPNVADVAQAYALTSALASQSFNYFVVGPRTSKFVLTLNTAPQRVTDTGYSVSCSNVIGSRGRKANSSTIPVYVPFILSLNSGAEDEI